MTVAALTERVNALEAAKLSDAELLTLRVLLRRETARLQKSADWKGPRELWQRFATWQKIAGFLGALLTILFTINQILSFIDRFAPVAPLHAVIGKH